MGSRASVLRTNVGIQVPSAHRVLRVESLDGDDPRDLILTPISTDLMIDVSPLERISEKADFDPIVNREIRFVLRDGSSHTVPRRDSAPDRLTHEDSSSKRYFCHGDQSDVVANVQSDVHGCIQSVLTEEITATESHLDEIRFQSKEMFGEGEKRIDEKEKELIQQLLVEQKKLFEKISIEGKKSVEQCEEQYRRLLEEFIKKLEIQMTKNLDQLQHQLQFNRETVRQTSDANLQLLIRLSQQARNQFQANLQSSTQQQIQTFFQKRKELEIKKTQDHLGFEQLRTLNLQIYSTVGKIDEEEGCANITERKIFREQIHQTKTNQPTKRVVYLDNRILQ